MTVIVIGAGAAGLIAAGKAAQTADEVILVEKNDIVGKKISARPKQSDLLLYHSPFGIKSRQTLTKKNSLSLGQRM